MNVSLVDTFRQQTSGDSPDPMMPLRAMQTFTRLMVSSPDEATLLAIIDVIVESLGKEHTHGTAYAWLESLTGHTFDHDAAAWTRFWAANRERGVQVLLGEGARGANPLMRVAALAMLSRLAPTDAALAASTANLTHEIPLVRITAAGTLWRFGDRRGAEALVEALSYGATLRAQAFQSLAREGVSTLGFDPAGDERERVAAIGRWRRWLETSAAPEAAAE